MEEKRKYIKELLNAYKSEVDNFNDAIFEDKFESLTTDIVKLFAIPVITHRYLFFYEDEGEKGYNFEIEAKDHKEAFDKAYESYGPQVEGMMYKPIS